MHGELINELQQGCELHHAKMNILEDERANDEAFRLEYTLIAEKYNKFKSDYYALKFKVFELMK